MQATWLCSRVMVQIADVVAHARIRPAVLQVECHPYLNQDKLLAFIHQYVRSCYLCAASYIYRAL